jgi:hypothetical protein
VDETENSVPMLGCICTNCTILRRRGEFFHYARDFEARYTGTHRFIPGVINLEPVLLPIKEKRYARNRI